MSDSATFVVIIGAIAIGISTRDQPLVIVAALAIIWGLAVGAVYDYLERKR